MDQLPEGAIPVNEADSHDLPEGAIPVESANLHPFAPIELPEGAIPVRSNAEMEAKYTTPGQKALAATEAAAQGATFGLSNKLETATGLTTEADILNREAANPGLHTVAGITGTVASALVPGVGEGWILSKGAAKLIPIANEMSKLSKIGRTAVRVGIESGGMQAGDEISHALLGKGNPTPVVAAHIAEAGALGMLTGAALGSGHQAIKLAQEKQLGKYLSDFSIGLGAASEGRFSYVKDAYQAADVSMPKGMQHGGKFYDETSKLIGKAIAKKTSEATGAAVGAGAGLLSGIPGAPGVGATLGYKAAEKYIDPYAEKLASKVTPAITKKVIVPIMLQALKTGDATGIVDALNYGTKAAKGAKLIQDSVDAVLKTGGQKTLNFVTDESKMDKLNQYIEDGGINQQIQDLKQEDLTQNYAEGGKVIAKPLSAESGLARLYPDHNMLLTAAKGRTAGYLNSIRPQPSVGRLPFDIDHKDEINQKSYRRALEIANQPLKTLQYVQNGTLLPDHVKHLNQMYPELYDHLKQKMSESLLKKQLNNERPDHKTIQSLSLFLGTPLKREFTPFSIQAAQSTFIPNQVMAQQGQKPKNDTKALEKVSKQYQTREQARDARANKN